MSDIGVGKVHAVAPDGTAVCAGTLVRRVDSCSWPDVPPDWRCGTCQAMLDFIER